MLKRQDSFLSSSSRRENATPLPLSKPPPAKKPVGCMSGIFRIFSKFQLHRRRKFLSFGESKQANIYAKPSEARFVSVLPKSDNSNKSLVDEKEYLGELSGGGGGGGGFSCEIPRSPSTLIVPETHRTKSQDFTIASPAPPPPAAPKNADMRPETIMSSSGAEKRRKLLDALNKCDHDLKAVKKIIQSVQFEEDRADQYNSPASTTKTTNAWSWADVVMTTPSAATKHSTRATEQDFKLSSLSSNNSIYSRRHGTTMTTAPTGRMITQQHKLSVRKKQEHYHDMEDAGFMKKFKEVLLNTRYKPKSSSSWSSKAMKESVDEVCGDIYWGEMREIRQLGLELQAFICRDLIEEIVKDFGYFHSIHNYSSLPFQACRRKLQF